MKEANQTGKLKIYSEHLFMLEGYCVCIQLPFEYISNEEDCKQYSSL